MKLKEYLAKYRISVEEFSCRVDISATSIWQYFNGTRRPTQKNAERIEKESDGLVTVMDMRGEDKRLERKK